MRKKLKFLFFISLFVSILFFNAHAISAKSAIVIDADSEEVLFSLNENEVLPMASTTKIMTALVAIEQNNLDKQYIVKKEYTLVEGSSMYLKVGEKISILDTLYGLMLMSGNDAALAIAGECGGMEEFVKQMNEKAKNLGLSNTHFDNPNGLDSENHHTTAFELAKLTAYAIKNPIFEEIVSTKSYQTKERMMVNHNKLLKLYDDCIGVKTGFTKKSGRCLVSAARKNNRTLICVTLNAPDDWKDHMQLLDNAFNLYKPYNIQKKGDIIGNVQCQSGVKNSVNLCVNSDITLWLTPKEKNKIKSEIWGRPFVYAPVNIGDVYGKINYTINGNTISESDIVFSSSCQILPEKLSLIKKIKKQLLSLLNLK